MSVIKDGGVRVDINLNGARWRKSSLSNDGGDCVEVAVLEAPTEGHKADQGPLYAVRDSKDPEGPKLMFNQREWDAFVGGVKNGEFDN